MHEDGKHKPLRHLRVTEFRNLGEGSSETIPEIPVKTPIEIVTLVVKSNVRFGRTRAMDRRQFLNQFAGFSLGVAICEGGLQAETPRAGIAGGTKLNWQRNLKVAHKLAVQQDKPIMIVFGASWCTFCRKLENETLNDKKTMAMIERDFIPVHLDFDRDEKIAKILEVERLPCTVILTPDADLLLKAEGYAEPKEFQTKLHAALEKRADIRQVKLSEGRN
jgi:thiol-disulfide isomerase/thioredoxin